MTKEFKDIALEFKNNDSIATVNESQLAYAQSILTNILHFFNSDKTMDSIKPLCITIIDKLLSDNGSVVYSFKNAQQLDDYLTNLLEENNSEFLENKLNYLVPAVTAILKVIFNDYMPPPSQVYIFNLIRNGAPATEENKKEVELFLMSLWSSFVFVNSTKEFELFNNSVGIDGPWFFMTITNNEIEKIIATIPDTSSTLAKVITYDKTNDKFTFEFYSLSEQITKKIEKEKESALD